jgi:tetratricopeptide (TPR) repeat protein
MLYFARRYDEAIGQFRKAITMDPKFYLHHYGLASTYLQKGNFAEAIAEFRTADTLMGGSGDPQSHLAARLCSVGEEERSGEATRYVEAAS